MSLPVPTTVAARGVHQFTHMNRSDFLQVFYKQRCSWDMLLERVDPERMTIPGVEGDCSIKDILTHVTWYEREMVELLQRRRLAGSDLWNLPHAERNALIYQQNRTRSPEDVLTEASAVYQQLLDLMEGLSDAELGDPRPFADMPEDWIPWQLIAENTYDHYRDHAQSIQAWLDRSEKS